MKTPCIRICKIDPANRQCLGCFRTLAEIGGWASMTDSQRDTVIADLDRRRAAYSAAQPVDPH